MTITEPYSVETEWVRIFVNFLGWLIIRGLQSLFVDTDLRIINMNSLGKVILISGPKSRISGSLKLTENGTLLTFEPENTKSFFPILAIFYP